PGPDRSNPSHEWIKGYHPTRSKYGCRLRSSLLRSGQNPYILGLIYGGKLATFGHVWHIGRASVPNEANDALCFLRHWQKIKIYERDRIRGRWKGNRHRICVLGYRIPSHIQFTGRYYLKSYRGIQ